MANNGTINEYFDNDALRQQQKTAVDLIREYIAITEKAKPIVVSLNIDNQKLSQILTSLEKVVNLTNEQADISAKAALASQRLAAARLSDAKAAETQERGARAAAKETERAGKAARDAESPYRQLSKAFNDAALKAKDLAAAYGLNHPKAQQAIKDAKQLHTQLLSIEQATGDSRRNVGNYSSAFSGLNNALSSLAMPTLSLSALGAGFNAVVDAASRFANLSAGIRAVTDSEQEQAEVLTYLNTIANRYGQSVEVLAGTYKSLAAATKGTSLEGRETRRIFESIVTAGTALKLTNEQVEGSLLAVQQMISKGKVSSEELRGQLGERLPGAYALFAKAAGLTTAELEKQLKAGKVLAQDVLPKFATLLNETYSSKALQNAQGLGNETERLSNAWLTFANSFANQTGLLSFFATFKSGLASALTSVTGFMNDPSMQSFLGIFTGRNVREAAIDQQRQSNLEKFKNSNKAERDEMLKDAQAKVNIYNDRLESVDLKKLDELNKRIFQSRQVKGTGGVNRFVVLKDTEETKRLKDEKNLLLGNLTEERVTEARKLRNVAVGEYNTYLKTNQQLLEQEAELEKRRQKEILEAKGEGDEKALKKAAQLREKFLAENEKRLAEARKAQFELEKLEQQRRINEQSAQASFEGFTPDTRIAARKKQFAEESRLIEMTREFEIEAITATENAEARKAQKEFAGQVGLSELLSNIHQEAADKRAAIELKVIDDIQQANVKSLADIISIRQQFNEQVKKDGEELLKITEEQNRKRVEGAIAATNQTFEYSVRGTAAAADAQLNALVASYKRGEIDKQEYERRKLEIETKARREALLAEIAHYEKLIQIIGLPAEKEKEYLEKLAALRKQLNKEDVQDTEKTEAEKTEIRKKTNAKVIELADEVRGLTFDLLTAEIDREKNKNQERIDSIEQRKAKEIEAETAKLQSTQDRAAAISAIEARAQSEREQIEARNRKLNQERAKYEKAAAVATIITNTALGIARVVAEVPKVDYGISTGILIGLYTALGAAQIARVLATPIPAYGEGTMDHPGGKAYVGDAGKKELVWTPDGKVFKTPSVPTVVDMPAHSMVFPDFDQAMKLMAGTITGKQLATAKADEGVMMTEDLKKEMRILGDRVTKTIRNKSEMHLTFETPVQSWVKSGQSWFKRL